MEVHFTVDWWDCLRGALACVGVAACYQFGRSIMRLNLRQAFLAVGIIGGYFTCFMGLLVLMGRIARAFVPIVAVGVLASQVQASDTILISVAGLKGYFRELREIPGHRLWADACLKNLEGDADEDVLELSVQCYQEYDRILGRWRAAPPWERLHAYGAHWYAEGRFWWRFTAAGRIRLFFFVR